MIAARRLGTAGRKLAALVWATWRRELTEVARLAWCDGVLKETTIEQ